MDVKNIHEILNSMDILVGQLSKASDQLKAMSDTLIELQYKLARATLKEEKQ